MGLKLVWDDKEGTRVCDLIVDLRVPLCLMFPLVSCSLYIEYKVILEQRVFQFIRTVMMKDHKLGGFDTGELACP